MIYLTILQHISDDWSYEAVKISKAMYAEHKNSHAFTVITPGTQITQHKYPFYLIMEATVMLTEKIS
jgi:hypothetical protein